MNLGVVDKFANLGVVDKYVNLGVVVLASHQQLGHTETRTQFKVSLERESGD